MKTSDDKNDEESDGVSFSRATSMNMNDIKKSDSPTSMGKYSALLRP